MKTDLPGRAADGAGAVELCKAESSRCQAVQVGSEWTGVSVAAQVPETQIISEEEDKIRRWSQAGVKKESCQKVEAGVFHSASSCI